MSSLNKSLESKFNDLKLAINEERGKWPTAQGVNALIIVYSPEEEKKYFKRIEEEFSDEYIIDLSQLFIKYIDMFGLETFKTVYKNYRSTSAFINEGEEDKDFLDLILDEIEKALDSDKMPVIIRSGILYGTGIRNKDILESDIVNKTKKPLLIFYPGEVQKDINDNEKVFFVNAVKANDYRGQLI
ncbi:MAG: hypothetical protein K9K76_01280 [Halanaerobiales bacterium]|nr:hypothetical protein [Halanaerobiales bacterium]